MPTLRSPVSGSRVTTQGSVMKRPPSRGQHCWMGRFSKVGQASRLSVASRDTWDRRDACPTLRMSGALGQGSARVGGASNLCTTSLQGPSFTTLGFAWRRSRAVPSSLTASLKLVGGLAFTSDPRSAETSSSELAPRLIAMRREEPSALMAKGNGEGCPLTVGFSTSSAWPPPGFFISRSASSVISNSVATGCVMRRSSPALSNRLRNSRNESNAMRGDYQTAEAKGTVIAVGERRGSVGRNALCGPWCWRGPSLMPWTCYGEGMEVLPCVPLVFGSYSARTRLGHTWELRQLCGVAADPSPGFDSNYAVASNCNLGERGQRKFFSAHSSSAKGT